MKVQLLSATHHVVYLSKKANIFIKTKQNKKQENSISSFEIKALKAFPDPQQFHGRSTYVSSDEVFLIHLS